MLIAAIRSRHDGYFDVHSVNSKDGFYLLHLVAWQHYRSFHVICFLQKLKQWY